MRKFIFLIAIVSIFGCDNNGDTNPDDVKHFNSEYLDQLNLANIDSFWSEGIAIDTSYEMGAIFENHSGFIEGIRLYSRNGKAIWISVFNTEDDAINAMELRINDVACVINNGSPEEFENQWWYSDCFDYLIFVNHLNTIIEIDLASNAPFEFIKGTLLDVAEEIKGRIDVLSV